MSTLLFADQKGCRNNLRMFYLRRGLLRADRGLAVATLCGYLALFGVQFAFARAGLRGVLDRADVSRAIPSTIEPPL